MLFSVSGGWKNGRRLGLGGEELVVLVLLRVGCRRVDLIVRLGWWSNWVGGRGKGPVVLLGDEPICCRLLVLGPNLRCHVHCFGCHSVGHRGYFFWPGLDWAAFVSVLIVFIVDPVLVDPDVVLGRYRLLFAVWPDRRRIGHLLVVGLSFFRGAL